MYCRHCGSEVNKNAEYCMGCGKRPLNGFKHCYNCSAETAEDQEICLKCGVNLKKVKISESDTPKDIYCKHCGSGVNENAEICISCGRRHLTGIDFCQNCGCKTSENQEICTNCGVRLQDIAKSEKTQDYKLNSDEYSEYYRHEFKKIKSSNDTYKGKWNWAAFFFGPLWAIYKGMWQIALLVFLIALITSWTYIIPILVSVVLGLRGNYFYYRFREHGEGLPDFKNIFNSNKL